MNSFLRLLGGAGVRLGCRGAGAGRRYQRRAHHLDDRSRGLDRHSLCQRHRGRRRLQGRGRRHQAESDPARRHDGSFRSATRDARKLIEQDKVDVLIGSGSTPASIAITAVCHELKVPCITLSPVNMPGEPGSWMISMPQPPNLMVSVVVDYMKAAGVKTVGYIGYNDGWGDLVWGGLEKSAAARWHQNPDQRALRSRRYFSDGPGAAHCRGRAGCRHDRRIGYARARCRSLRFASAATPRKFTARRRSSIRISSASAAPQSRA